MKKTPIWVAITAAIALSGCGDNNHFDQQAMIDTEIDTLASQQAITGFNQEKKELNQFVTTVQEKDPTVKGAYYGVDEKTGEKILYVERENESGNFLVSSFPGFIAGYALASMFNSDRSFFSKNATSTRTLTPQMADRFKKGNAASYLRNLKSSQIKSIRANPARMASVTKGVMSRNTSARSAGYSRGA